MGSSTDWRRIAERFLQYCDKIFFYFISIRKMVNE